MLKTICARKPRPVSILSHQSHHLSSSREIFTSVTAYSKHVRVKLDQTKPKLRDEPRSRSAGQEVKID